MWNPPRSNHFKDGSYMLPYLEFMQSLEKSHIPGDVAVIACTAATV